MFENDTNYSGSPSQNTAEPPLFKNYELRSWNFSSRIYKIFAISAIVNIVAIFSVAQTNLLTVKGCDSPIIGSVCQVLDTVYVGGKLYGTDVGYVDEAYEKTDLENSDITYLDLTGQEPPLTYPADYWQIANPEQFQASVENPAGGFPPVGNIPGIGTPVPSTGTPLESQPQDLPKSKGSVVDESKLPTSFGDVDGNTGKTYGFNVRPGKTTGPLGDGTVRPVKPGKGFPQLKADPPKTTPIPSIEDLKAIIINREPLFDLSKDVNKKLAANQLDLNAKVNIMAKGKLDETGKIEKGFVFAADDKSDPAMTQMVKDSIAALNDSGYLQYLKNLSGKDINVTVVQDDANFTATVQSEVESAVRATSLKTVLNLAINYYKDKKSGPEADENDKDDLALLNTATVETDGNKLVIKFSISKPEAQALIQKKLQLKPSVQPAKPQSTAQNQDSNTKTGK